MELGYIQRRNIYGKKIYIKKKYKQSGNIYGEQTYMQREYIQKEDI